MAVREAIDGQLYLEEKRKLTDYWLEHFLPPENESPQTLHQVMRYSVLAGGKRLRPILAHATYEYCGGDVTGDGPLPIHYAMAALEMVHTYSLIHDDLPCMDDDDLRRGIPTAHKKYGEAAAVLAGDALHDVAFGLMARTGSIQTVIELADAIGTQGMIGGQNSDIEAEGKEIDRDGIIAIHTQKTAALIRCSVRVGQVLAEAGPESYQRLSEYGEKIGLAFQIIDDLLDIEGDQELLGKTIGADNKMKKATYPGVVGVDAARSDAQKLISEAVNTFDLSDRENILCYIAEFIGERTS
ncbi:MAG: polyprenyl synthetase family protein [bacterium]|nr:polyprenyl synthetase family protein [bacterium]